MSHTFTRIALILALFAALPLSACRRDTTPSKAVYNPPAGKSTEPKKKKNKKRDKAEAKAEGFKDAKAKKKAGNAKDPAKATGNPPATPEKKSE